MMCNTSSPSFSHDSLLNVITWYHRTIGSVLISQSLKTDLVQDVLHFYGYDSEIPPSLISLFETIEQRFTTIEKTLAQIPDILDLKPLESVSAMKRVYLQLHEIGDLFSMIIGNEFFPYARFYSTYSNFFTLPEYLRTIPI